MKKLYKKLIFFLEQIILKIHIFKTWTFEIITILKKRKLYNNIIWTKDQQIEFDKFWEKNYGKKISSRWHKLYESINGIHNIRYIPEIIYSVKIEPYLNEYKKSKVLEDKSFLDLFFSYFNSSENSIYGIAKTILLKDNGIYYDKNREVISEDEVIKKIKMINYPVVLKPTKETSSGDGVKLIKNEENLIKIFIKNNLYNSLIVQEKIEQSMKLEALNSGSVNTLRAISCIIDNRVIILSLSLRVGVNESFVDNIHAGGIVVGVNNENKLYKYGYRLGYGDSDKKYTIHPTSKIKFENYYINGIENIREAVKILHGRLVGIRMISWDFTLDKNRVPILIETNLIGQSCWFPQIVSGEGLFQENIEKILKEIREVK